MGTTTEGYKVNTAKEYLEEQERKKNPPKKCHSSCVLPGTVEIKGHPHHGVFTHMCIRDEHTADPADPCQCICDQHWTRNYK